MGRKVGCTLKLAVIKEDQEKEGGLSLLRFYETSFCLKIESLVFRGEIVLNNLSRKPKAEYNAT